MLAGEDQALLVWWDAFLVLNLALDIVDCVAGLHLEGDGLAREGLYEAVEGMLVERWVWICIFALVNVHLHCKRCQYHDVAIYSPSSTIVLTICGLRDVVWVR